MLGEYGHFRKWFTNRSTTKSVLTSDAGPFTLIAARSANHQTYIQRVLVNVTTYAAKTWAFADSNGTPVQDGFISIPSAAPTTDGYTSFILDYGPEGLALTVGKDLTLTLSASGVAAQVRVEAYEKIGTPMAIGTNN